MGNNSKHLEFIYDRLISVHKEDKNYDYMLRLKEIITETKASEDNLKDYLQLINKHKTTTQHEQ